jgi:hypothetical protein
VEVKYQLSFHVEEYQPSFHVKVMLDDFLGYGRYSLFRPAAGWLFGLNPSVYQLSRLMTSLGSTSGTGVPSARLARLRYLVVRYHGEISGLRVLVTYQIN